MEKYLAMINDSVSKDDLDMILEAAADDLTLSDEGYWVVRDAVIDAFYADRKGA